MSTSPPRNALIAVIIFTLGTSFRMGYGMSSFNPTFEVLTKLMNKTLIYRYNIPENSEELGFIGEWIWSFTTSIMFLSATFGALTVTFLCKQIRRNGLLISQFIFITGSLISSCSYFNMFELMILGQSITGYALGFSCSVLTGYIDEISDQSYSHILHTLIAVSVEFGTTTANFLGIDIFLGREHTWPVIFLFPIVLHVVCITFLVIGQKETPVQLLKQKRRAEALKSVHFYYQIFSSKDVEAKLCQIEKEMSESGSHNQKTTLEALIHKKNRKALLLSVGTSTITNFSGILAITIFGTKLMVEYGNFNNTVSGFANAGVFMSSFIGLLLILFTNQNIPHKLLLLIGLPVMLVINVCFMLVMIFMKGTPLALAFICILIILFCLAFSNSVEKVMWFNGSMYTSPEYFEATSSITVAATYFTAFASPFIYYPAQINFGHFSFLMFIFSLVVAWILFFIFYPSKRVVWPTAGSVDKLPVELGGREIIMEEDRI